MAEGTVDRGRMEAQHVRNASRAEETVTTRATARTIASVAAETTVEVDTVVPAVETTTRVEVATETETLAIRTVAAVEMDTEVAITAATVEEE